MKLGDKSIQSEDRLVRVYPEKNLFSHIIGQIDDNNNGISGIEKNLDEDLKDIKKLKSATALVHVKKDAFYVNGHFPNNPVL